MNHARLFAPAALLLVGCLLVWNVRTQEKMALRAPLATLLPRDVPGYKVAEQTIAAEERRVAGMTDYVMRIYGRDSTDAYSAYVGYYDYQTQGKTVHSPRNCMPGAGWEVLQPGTIALAANGGTHRVNRYLLANSNINANVLVLYWYQGRGRVEANEYLVKWHLLRDAALHGRTDEALVRIIVPVDTRPDGSADPAALARAERVAVAAGQRLMTQVAAALPPAPGARTQRLAVAVR